MYKLIFFKNINHLLRFVRVPRFHIKSYSRYIGMLFVLLIIINQYIKNFFTGISFLFGGTFLYLCL